MSIATRINAIEEHIGNAYDKIEDLGIDLTNVDKNIDNIAEMLDTIYEDYPKVTGTGTELTLDGTKAGKMGLNIKGNSTQETTTGGNILPVRQTSSSLNGITWTVNKDGSITINGTTTAQTIICINGTSNYIIRDIPTDGNKIYIGMENSSNTRIFLQSACLVDGSTVYTNATSGSANFTADANTTWGAAIIVRNEQSFNNETFYPRANYGTSLMSYEPYTGGIASPNPSYEQPIYSAGDTGTISEKIVNKNLFDKNTVLRDKTFTSQDVVSTSTGLYVSDYIKVKPSTSYYVNENCSVVIGLDKDKNPLGYIKNNSLAGTITTPNNCEWIRVRLYNTNIDMETAIANAMVNVGSTATTYTAHQEQTYTIPCQQPMRSIGTVRDEFVNIDGTWYERHWIFYYVLTGTETVQKSGYSTNDYFCGYVSIRNPQTINFKGECSHFQYGRYVDEVKESYYFANTAINGTFNICILASRLTDNTVAGAKAWIKAQYDNGTPVEIMSAMTNPVDLPCTEEQISILETIPTSYNEQTNIYSLDVTPAYIEAEALKGE